MNPTHLDRLRAIRNTLDDANARGVAAVEVTPLIDDLIADMEAFPVNVDTPDEPNPTLTDRQAIIFNFMLRFYGEHHYSPTVRDVMADSGINSPNGVMCHFKTLEKKGLIRRDRMLARGVTFLRMTPYAEAG